MSDETTTIRAACACPGCRAKGLARHAETLRRMMERDYPHARIPLPDSAVDRADVEALQNAAGFLHHCRGTEPVEYEEASADEEWGMMSPECAREMLHADTLREIRAGRYPGARYDATTGAYLFRSSPAPAERDAGEPANGVALIAAERRRQVEAEGWTPEHDAQHDDGSLALAAAAYAVHAAYDRRPTETAGDLWPWSENWWKPTSRLRCLEKAGALIAAEIDRILAPPEGEAP